MQFNKIKNFKKVKLSNGLIFILILLLLFFAFGLFNNDNKEDKISFDGIIKGIKNNDFSEIIAKNEGKVVLKGKNIFILDAIDNQNVLENFKNGNNYLSGSDFKSISLIELVNLLNNSSYLSQFRFLLDPNKLQESISDIIVGENFILAINKLSESSFFTRRLSFTDQSSSNNLIKGFIFRYDNVNNLNKDSFQSFESFLQQYGIKLRDLPINIFYVSFGSKYVQKNVFDSRFQKKHFHKVIELDGSLYGILKDQYVNYYSIDWNNNVASFINTLQQEELNLNSNGIYISTQNVPPTIGFSDILTLLSLVAFGFLAYILFKGAQSSGMGIAQFGQSRAKIFFGSKTDTTFKDVAGIDEAKDELNEIVEFLKNPDKFRKLGARIPKGVLMVGPPGTGKTLLARAIAGEANVPFFHTSGSEFEEMLVGAGASRVRDLFAKAKRVTPALIFIDEIDAVARKRGTKIQSSTTEQTLNQILVEMDGFEKNTNLIVLAATNRPDVLDPAILRPGRFDRQIRIDIPDMEGRRQILEVHSKNKPLGKDVSLEKIAKRTVGFTGADLENILNEAAILAARQNKKEINMDDIEEAVSKVVLGPAKKNRKRTEEELKLVAYHEAGHAIVSKFMPEFIPVDKISIVSRGRTGGVTLFIPEKDENIISKKRMLSEICVLLGGRAAEFVALNDISTGASNDIERATALARRMVQKFGMSDKLGLVQYGDFEENEYLGYAYNTTKEYSDKTAQMIDEEVKSIIDNAYSKALDILNENRVKLEELANLLLEKEVISKEEFESLFK